MEKILRLILALILMLGFCASSLDPHDEDAKSARETILKQLN
jgi:PBP1b-binding outer membrane lipoprotein LpoB